MCAEWSGSEVARLGEAARSRRESGKYSLFAVTCGGHWWGQVGRMESGVRGRENLERSKRLVGVAIVEGGEQRQQNETERLCGLEEGLC